MADLTILERKDRDDGLSLMWVSLDGERARFSISTATLDSASGHDVLTMMAQRATGLTKTARERGRLRLEGPDVNSRI